MKKLFEEFKKLKTAQKAEAALALIITLALIICIPVFAWFSDNYNLETMTKIKSPDNLDIRAGHYHPIINFELSSISIEDMQENNTPEYRVFSVSAGDYKLAYRIQLAHTTNIPFKYTIYTATEVNAGGAGIVDYKPIYKDPDDTDPEGTTYHYEIGDEVELTVLNADDRVIGGVSSEDYFGRTLASGSDGYYNATYLGTDRPEQYAIPLYLQSEKIMPSDKGEGVHDYFILKIEWDAEAAETNFTKWNRAENNKETDIIYISASRSVD